MPNPTRSLKRNRQYSKHYATEHCLFLFYHVHPITNPSHGLNILRPAGIIFYFLSKAADMRSDIAVIPEVFSVPDEVVNLLFGKNTALMKSQYIKDTELLIIQDLD